MPVTNEAASELSQTTASAISSGRAKRLTGVIVINCSRMLSMPAAAASANAFSNSGVSVVPGITALMRMPASVYSRAAVLVSPFKPNSLAT